MNKLNTIIIIFLSCVFLSPVFATVSYANADIFKEGQTLLTQSSYCGATRTTSTLPTYVEGGDQSEQRKFIMSTLYDYFNNHTNSDYDFTNFNHLIDTSLNYYSDLYGKNYNGYYILFDYVGSGAYSSTFKLYFYQKNDIDILYDKIASVSGTYHQSVSFVDGSDFIFINVYSSGFSSSYYENAIGNCFFRFNQYYQKYSFSSNTSIKQSNTSVMNGSEANAYIFTWDGTSYYQYIDDPDTPTFPTNAEIASAVQKFYNSDIYKNNTNFKDFIVVYYVHNHTYAFIGHTVGADLGQVIVPAGLREQGKVYGEQWWHFFINENAGAPPLGTTFYLYTSSDNGDTFIDDGVGKINELINIDFSSNAVIVYSTSDYPVRTYVLDDTTGETTYTDGVIEGDQYTYDENLDPTQNGYNPLDNFVTVDPSDSIVNNADFDSLSSSFEQFIDLFNFTENMQWLAIANNKLSNYFIGFIIMACALITIGRILKG